MQVFSQLQVPALYAWERTPVPTEEGPGWSPEPVWTISEKRTTPRLPEFEPRIVQPLSYTWLQQSSCMEVGKELKSDA